MAIEYPIPETYGWDTVFAIDIREVNRALAGVPESPTFTATSPVPGGSVTLNWAFRNWRITDTPGGDRIEVGLDFTTKSVLVMPGGKETKLDGWTCKVLFAAHFDEIDPITQTLKAKTATGGKWASVSVEPPDGVDPNDLFGEMAAIDALITKWFADDPEAVKLFSQEFATVDIGTDLAAQNVYYLQPLVLGFAGAVMADGITRALGILAMTRDSLPTSEGPPSEAEIKAAEDRARNATLQLSPNAIMPNAKAGFIVSARVFLEHMMTPACASAYSAGATSFELFGEGIPKLRNRKALAFQQKVDGVDRAAAIPAEMLRFVFEGSKLRHTITSMNIRAAWNASVDVTIREAYELRLAPKPGSEDEVIFLLENVGEIAPEIKPIADPGYVLGAEIIGTILDVVALGVGALTVKGPLIEKQWSVTAAKYTARAIAIAFALGGMGLHLSPLLVEVCLQTDPDKLPDFGKTLNVGLGRISWPAAHGTRFVPVEGHFANAMVVTIDPRFG